MVYLKICIQFNKLCKCEFIPFTQILHICFFQGSQSSLQSEITKLRSINRNSLKQNVEAKHIIKENEELSADNDKLKHKQNKLIDEMSEMQLNILYYKTRYKALQTKYDLETFNYDKYHSNISDLKEQLLQKQSSIEYSAKIVK